MTTVTWVCSGGPNFSPISFGDQPRKAPSTLGRCPCTVLAWYRRWFPCFRHHRGREHQRSVSLQFSFSQNHFKETQSLSNELPARKFSGDLAQQYGFHKRNPDAPTGHISQFDFPGACVIQVLHGAETSSTTFVGELLCTGAFALLPFCTSHKNCTL